MQLTSKMKEALITGDDTTVKGPNATIRALVHHGLCDYVRVDGGGQASSRLTSRGHMIQDDLRLQAGSEGLNIIRTLRRGRRFNHPALLVQSARNSALVAAELSAGRLLSEEERAMVREAVERSLDILESGTSRLLLCPHGDAVVFSETLDQAWDCPRHGTIVKGRGLALNSAVGLAVTYL